ncbi:MAG: UDP-N-acetylglucosamine--N-acetylmuramyl-(pentapeptide) pyrophosphoryl-undecaprenol N-acetylglucosamine transferase [Candidatus Pacebacteria bacterium]|nr:UDP-N-acetylglucosamine--N-acetylmuramyl-(pentapeptide) pyrophosphoryl-undecaprenol N-acetylglucosamine transferase [Candidatus Paceibacterota bacterium]
MRIKKILFTGGGSGGHVVPIISIVREMRKLETGTAFEFFFLGPRDEFSQVLLSQEGIKVKQIVSGKMRRYGGAKTFFENLFDILFKIPLGIFQSFFHIFLISPDLIFSKGGFGSLPVAISGKLLFVPLFLHEADVIPGLANKFLGQFTNNIFVSFPKTEYFPLKKIIPVGNPVRKELLGGSKNQAKETFKTFSEKPVIFILGGSQGAQRINDEILEILPELLNNFEIIHQCGENNFKNIKSESKVIINDEQAKSYHLFPFLKEPEMRQAYALADLIISRAGSGTIFEIAASGKPSILIPLPEAAQNHQVKNAYAYAEKGAAIVIEEANFTSRFFFEKLKYLFSQPSEFQKMAQAAKEFSKPEAGRIIANYIIDYLK